MTKPTESVDEQIESFLLQYDAECHQGLNHLAGRGTPHEQAQRAIKRFILDARIEELETLINQMNMGAENKEHPSERYREWNGVILNRLQALKQERRKLDE